MSTRPPEQSYQDILDAIEAIESFTHRMDFEAFRTSPITIAAVERKLLVVAEAAVRLRGQPLPEHPWRNIRGIGNWIRHQYDAIDLETIWTAVTSDLEPLRAEVKVRLAELRGSDPSDRPDTD